MKINKMKSVLITGGNGYIAKSLIHGLSASFDVVGVTRKDFDITDSSAVGKWFDGKSFDVVIHAAVTGGSRLRQDSDGVYQTNKVMFKNILKHRSKFGRLISFGSGAELYSPSTPYGDSKLWIANQIKNNENCHNLRIFGVFDHNELNTRFIKANIIRYLNNEPMYIHQDKMMDFFYMQDLIGVVQHFIESSTPPKEVDCSYHHKQSLSDIATQINNLGNHTVPVHIELSGSSTYLGKPLELDIPLIGFPRGLADTFKLLSVGNG